MEVEPPWKWSVKYSTTLDCAFKQIYRGELWLRRGALRLVLRNEAGEIVDARFLHEGEKIEVKSDVEFPCHMATVDCSLSHGQQLMASMPQRMLNSAAGWWLHRSPAEVGQVAVSTGASVKVLKQLEKKQVSTGSSVTDDFGLGLFGPTEGDKRGSPKTIPIQTLNPPTAAATREATGEKEKRSYKEVLLSPTKEVAAGKKKKSWKPTRHKMAHRNQERGGEDRYRREDRADRERNWGMRRDVAVGGMSRGIINPTRTSPPPPFPRQPMQWQRKASSSTSQSSGQSSAPNVTPANPSSLNAAKAVPVTNKNVVCYKCEADGHSSKECLMKVNCLVCEKDTHITRRCVWPHQPKPVMPAVGLADPELGFFSA
jgi:hypothetical protein